MDRTYPVKDFSTILVADVFFRNFICRFGNLTDRGQQFVSKVQIELFKIFDITKLKTSSYRPQTNASMERANESIFNKLRTLIGAEQSN